ncbi:hypothetical protein F5Y16DRAFT_418958 [Xylariaceae sp. FL0255]|nr:hypothetical protein F5Y16DRAFT_418958 [Xylariaceae sp. FL0255]
MTTVPTTMTQASSPTKGVQSMKSPWEEEKGPITNVLTLEQRAMKGTSAVVEFRAEDLRLTSNVVADSGVAYTHIGSPPHNNEVTRTLPKEATIPRSQLPLQRGISFSGLSIMSSATSSYSQDGDDEEDDVPPLRTLQTKHDGMSGVMSTVAELRRMNSQVSSYSTTSCAAGMNMARDASPTLPALRGGGFSPSRKEAGGGVKNYLSLGNSPKGPDKSRKEKVQGQPGKAVEMTEQRVTEIVPDSRISGAGNLQQTDTCNNTQKNITSLRRGGVSVGGVGGETTARRRSRGNTVVMNFEQDLDRARQVLRESRGQNKPQRGGNERPEDEQGEGDRKLVTHASRLKKEEGRMSLESLGMYDEKEFRRNSTARQV